MPRYSININTMMQVSRKIADKLIRDYFELENLQSSQASAEKFAYASIRKISEMVINDIQSINSSDGILINGFENLAVNKDAKRRWVVDPINGLTNFIRSVPYFCFMISLEEKNKNGEFDTVATLIEVPILNEFFYAEKNMGAFSSRKRIRVSSIRDLESSLIACNVDVKNLSNLNKRQNNCLPIDFCFVASGKYDGCVMQKASNIEKSVATLIVKESGGKISNLMGGDLSNEDKDIFASNGNIHSELCKILKK